MRTLAERSITSVSWNAAANAATVCILFVRSVLLARLLPVETFGVYAGASAIVGFTVIGASFGMGSAFLHRAPETDDEDHAARIHFTLKALLTLAWAGLMLAGTLLFASGATRTALLLLTATTAGVQLAETPRLVLVRRVEHRRLAALQVTTAVLTTAIALPLAWRGITLWALLATNLTSLAVMTVGLFLWRPVWRPRLAWSRTVIRYYLRFGSRSFAAGILQTALDRLDDLWTRFYLGVTAMGFYSRAYTFATYPRRFLAAPIAAVVAGAYAELKEDRQRLSKTFFRANALTVRTVFFAAGVLALVAPEFIRILLGEKWLPMLLPFRLMLVFTMLDPLKSTGVSLFPAVGRPDLVIRLGAVQLGVLLLGLALLSPPLGITGVALAATASVTVGILMLFGHASRFVDFSSIRLFATPTLALTVAILLARSAIEIPGVLGSDWRTAGVKIVVFCTVYLLILIPLEGRDIAKMVHEMRKKR